MRMRSLSGHFAHHLQMRIAPLRQVDSLTFLRLHRYGRGGSMAFRHSMRVSEYFYTRVLLLSLQFPPKRGAEVVDFKCQSYFESIRLLCTRTRHAARHVVNQVFHRILRGNYITLR